MLAITVVCILSSWKTLFASLSSFLLPGIPVWTGIQLIVGIGVNLDTASLMALVVVFKSSFPLFTIFTPVNESVCIVTLSLAPLAYSRAVISASSTYAELLSLNDDLFFLVYDCCRHPSPIT